jgi:ribbon-helix-helix protein
MKNNTVVQLEERTARLTILIDPRKKAVLERLCAEEDLTSSQVVRQLIRTYIEQRLGRPWTPGDEGPSRAREAVARSPTKRRGPRA